MSRTGSGALVSEFDLQNKFLVFLKRRLRLDQMGRKQEKGPDGWVEGNEKALVSGVLKALVCQDFGVAKRMARRRWSGSYGVVECM